MKNNRRNFIKQGILAGGLGVFLTRCGIKVQSSVESSTHNPILKVKPLGFQWETQDPFLFCVHHEDAFPKGNELMGPPEQSLKGRSIGSDFNIKDGWRMYHGEKVPGFPGHPHRGFETITVVREGTVDHTDSLGASGRYGDGDVQWMTAGKGIQHAEMFPLIHKDKENPMELFQIWLNLPKANKFVDPHYNMLWGDKIPKVVFKDKKKNKTLVEVIAGAVDKNRPPAPPPNSWAFKEVNEVAVWNIKMEPGATWKVPKASEGVNRTIYFYSGDILKLNGHEVKEYHSADVLASKDITIQAGEKECAILILQGKPIGEPVVQHGPFVMNTKAELRQAFDDFQETEFGGWPWPKRDFVHPRESGRFAKHSDGRIETQS